MHKALFLSILIGSLLIIVIRHTLTKFSHNSEYCAELPKLVCNGMDMHGFSPYKEGSHSAVILLITYIVLGLGQ